jgi:hypothetical protein
MIVLDENIPEDQRLLLRSWRVRAYQVGRDVGRAGFKDEQQIIPLLLKLRRPTFFTRDLDFLTRSSVTPGTAWFVSRSSRTRLPFSAAASFDIRPATRRPNALADRSESAKWAFAWSTSAAEKRPLRGRRERQLWFLGSSSASLAVDVEVAPTPWSYSRYDEISTLAARKRHPLASRSPRLAMPNPTPRSKHSSRKYGKLRCAC